MSKMKLLVITVMALAISAFVASSLYATVEVGKKEGKPCTHCHTKAGSKDLNDTGKCYKEKGSLGGC